jgi:hypothetical protein
MNQCKKQLEIKEGSQVEYEGQSRATAHSFWRQSRPCEDSCSSGHPLLKGESILNRKSIRESRDPFLIRFNGVMAESALDWRDGGGEEKR